MRNWLLTILTAGLVACGGGSGDTGDVEIADPCSNAGQKKFVLDQMRLWYLWNDLLPADVNLDDHATPEDLLAFLSSFQPLDNFSFINSAEADAAFFGEGRFEGFGFSYRLLSADEMRFTRVFAGSPADNGGLARGQRVISIDGRSVSSIRNNEGLGAYFDNNADVSFEIEPLSGPTFTASIQKAIVTIPPIPQWRVIDTGNGTNVGYMEFSTFISTADAEFDTVFAAFRSAGVNDVILDLRYNGGGLVSTAELLGDYLGGLIAENLTFSRTEFNADRAAQNNSEEFFERRGNSMSLSRLVIIATQGTASASELVTNGLIPHADVVIVGDRTFGKPVGQIGLEFCEKILRPTAFKTVNANGDGDFFDGLPVGAGCAAPDDLSVAVGDLGDPNMVKALGYLNTGACPVSALPPEVQKAGTEGFAESSPKPREDRRGPPHRELLDAF